MMYVLKGPADCGNIFGVHRAGLVPLGRFAVVEDGEYANGGWGPSLTLEKAFASKSEADEAMRRLTEERGKAP